MSHEAFEKIQDSLNEALQGKDSPFGNSTYIADVSLADVLLSSERYADVTLRMWLQEKPKRYTWLWVAEYSDGSTSTKRSENTPWFSRIPCDYEDLTYKTYKIEESKQEIEL